MKLINQDSIFELNIASISFSVSKEDYFPEVKDYKNNYEHE